MMCPGQSYMCIYTMYSTLYSIYSISQKKVKVCAVRYGYGTVLDALGALGSLVRSWYALGALLVRSWLLLVRSW